MARKLPFLLNGSVVEIEADSTIHREDLYGKATRRIEKDGQVLTKGVLTPDGHLFPSSDFKFVKTDHDGSVAGEIEARTVDGKQAPVFVSSSKEARELVPIPGNSFPDLAVDGVIPVVVPAAIPDGFYATSYTYRDSTNLQDAVLVAKGEESFLLVGEKKESPFLQKGETYSFFEEEEATESEEDGFNMF